MVFKRVDRYIGVAFLARLVFCLGVVAALYVGFDLLKRLDELSGSESGDTLFLVVQYYAYVLPLFLLDLVPAAVLIGAGMVLVRMSSHRELLALQASGTSVYRVVAPIFIWTVVVSAGVSAARETFIPELARQQSNLRQSVEGDVRKSVTVSDPSTGAEFYFGFVSFGGHQVVLRKVAVLEFHPQRDSDPRRELRRQIYADEAVLSEGILTLNSVNVVKTYGPAPAFDPAPVQIPPTGSLAIPTQVTQAEIARAAEDSEKVGPSSRRLVELRRLMQRHPRVAAYSVAFHWKLAAFFNPFVLLLVGIPCLIGQENALRSRFVGVLVSIAVAAAFYTLIFVFNSIGESGTVHPALAGWLPVTVIGSLGLYLFESRLS